MSKCILNRVTYSSTDVCKYDAEQELDTFNGYHTQNILNNIYTIYYKRTEEITVKDEHNPA